MQLSNEIVLRPRFQLRLSQDRISVLEAFGKAKTTQQKAVVSIVEDHIFIRIPKAAQHFWSPQLHLELMDNEEGGCTIFGLFGPNPTVWTFFMFVHFAVATAFIALGIWAYTNASLNEPYMVQLACMVLLMLLWIGLYLGGQIGKKTGESQMGELHEFMQATLPR
jgi:hypothetical protein